MMGKTWPDEITAERIFAEAEKKHGGNYALHSRNAAQAARRIAERAGMDAQKAYVFGLLHDIGRCEGWTGERHMYDGYKMLCEMGYSEAARICITHGYMIQNIDTSIGVMDMTAEERDFVARFLQDIIYDDYDRLIQLCDAIADKDGFCILEKRFVDVTLRYGIHPYTLARWEKTIELRDYFNKMCGCSIYDLLPGIERNSIR